MNSRGKMIFDLITTPATATSKRLNKHHLAHLWYVGEKLRFIISGENAMIVPFNSGNYAQDHDLAIYFPLLDHQGSFIMKVPNCPDNRLHPKARHIGNFLPGESDF